MKTIAYLRVSREDQNINSQRLSILEYCNKLGIHIDKFVDIKISSRKNIKERKIEQILEMLERYDTLIVSELSRLGRSLGQIINIVDECIKKEVKLISIKENLILSGKQDMQSKITIALFGLFAEIERDLIAERTKEGLAIAKQQGIKLGRKKGTISKSKLDSKKEEIKILINKGVPKSSIAKITDVSRNTVVNFIKSRKLS